MEVTCIAGYFEGGALFVSPSTLLAGRAGLKVANGPCPSNKVSVAKVH